MTNVLKWITNSTGKLPRVRWLFTAETPLKTLCLARETGEVLAGDEAGMLYLLNRQGELIHSTGGFNSLNYLAISENGQAATAVLGNTKLVWLNREGGIVGTKNLSSDILSLAMDPHGYLVAVSLSSNTTSIYRGKRDRLANFTTDRPLNYLNFLATEPKLIGASEYGLMGLYDLQGDELWKQNFSNNMGDLTIRGDGSQIYIAGFNLGIQKFDSFGDREGAIQVEGSPQKISTSYHADKIATATLENHLYWLNEKGKTIWEAKTPTNVCNLICDPAGQWLICGLSTGEIYCFDWQAW